MTPFLLGVCFLQQRNPKLIFFFGVDRHQPIVDSWQVVIDDNIHPLSKPPELSKKVGWGGEEEMQVSHRTECAADSLL